MIQNENCKFILNIHLFLAIINSCEINMFYFRYTTLAKMVDTDTGNLFIIGSFNKRTDPDFKVSTNLF